MLTDGCPDFDCGFLSRIVLWEASWKENEFSGKGLGKERGNGQHKVVDKSYEVDDMFDKELGREEDIHFYMSRSGTKVHFNGQCQGLQNADPRYVIKKPMQVLSAKTWIDEEKDLWKDTVA